MKFFLKCLFFKTILYTVILFSNIAKLFTLIHLKDCVKDIMFNVHRKR